MNFFLYEIMARIVAIYLCLDSARRVWHGLGERKIADWNDSLVDWFLFDWSKVIFYRDVTPIRYWILIGLQIFAFSACLIVAVFGWLRPSG